MFGPFPTLAEAAQTLLDEMTKQHQRALRDGYVKLSEEEKSLRELEAEYRAHNEALKQAALEKAARREKVERLKARKKGRK